MIILDACTVEGMSLQGSSAELLRALREIGVQRIGIPWPAMQELIAHKTMEYRDAHASASSALNQLNRRTPWAEPQRLPDLQLEDAREHWRNEFEKLAEVIPVSLEALQESMFREANVLPPCKTAGAKKMKVGGRDAAIWLSAIEFAERNEQETIYFVSGNTNDFTHGTEYPELMAQDVLMVRDRFVHLTALDDVVSRFAQPVKSTPPRQRKLSTTRKRQPQSVSPWRSPIHVNAATTCPGAASSGSWWTLRTLAGACGRVVEGIYGAADRSGQDPGYQIGWHKWCMATTSWLVVGLAQIDGRKPTVAASTWEVRLLFSLAEREDGTPFTILRSFKPEAPSTDRDVNTFGALVTGALPFDADADPFEEEMARLERTYVD